MSDHAATTEPVSAGRALADRLKREALEELPILLALWEDSEAQAASAA